MTKFSLSNDKQKLSFSLLEISDLIVDYKKRLRERALWWKRVVTSIYAQLVGSANKHEIFLIWLNVLSAMNDSFFDFPWFIAFITGAKNS